MGSGKTTVGRLVAERLGRRFLDSDQQVEARAGRTVRAIFEAEGETAFRRLESDALAEALADPEPVVVAAAGGVVLDPRNRRLLDEAATVVWLRAEAPVLAARVRSGDHRPLLAGNALAVLARMEAERGLLYAEVADHVVEAGATPVSQVVAAVLEAVAS